MELDRAVENLLEAHDHDLRVDGVGEEARVPDRLAAQCTPRIDRPSHHGRIPPRMHGLLRPAAEQPRCVKRSRRAAVDRIEQWQQIQLLDGNGHAGRVGTTRASALDHEDETRVVGAMPRRTTEPAALAQQLKDRVCHYCMLHLPPSWSQPGWPAEAAASPAARLVMACSVRTVVSMSPRSNWLSRRTVGPPTYSRRLSYRASPCAVRSTLVSPWIRPSASSRLSSPGTESLATFCDSSRSRRRSWRDKPGLRLAMSFRAYQVPGSMPR